MSHSQAAGKADIRQAGPDDAPACSPICYNAFRTINERHGFPPDIPTPERATRILTWMFSHPAFYCVVAEVDGRIVGSNCLDERSFIAGIGPITVDPGVQNSGVGRRLMEAVLDRARARSFAGVRLVQAAFHSRSLALYTNLGFQVREPLACLQGRAQQRNVPGCAVRPATEADRPASNSLALRVHGFHRGRELEDSIRQGTAVVVERGGRITGYASSLAFHGHAVGETNLDLQALIASADFFDGPGILAPTRNGELFRWCLDQGLRVVQPMTLMSIGLYNEPGGAWLPSVSF